MRRAILTTMMAAALLFEPGILSYAQSHGVPPSVTSRGPSGLMPAGPPASVTSLGPRGLIPTGPRASVTSLGPRGFAGGFDAFDRTRMGGGRVHFGHRHRRVPFLFPYYFVYSPFGYDPFAYEYPLMTAGPSYEEADPPASTIFERRAMRALPAEAPDPAPPPAPARTGPVEQQPTTVLVFRDGHRVEVQNYAIVGDTLINLNNMGPHKIALADLDVDTTTKLNDDRGVEFRLPQKGT